jgi:hypothetical protein
MIDHSLLQTHLVQTETVLADLRQRRGILDREIATFEEAVRIDREMLGRFNGHSAPEPAAAAHGSEKTSRPSFADVLGKQRPRYGSKKHRVLIATAEFLENKVEASRNAIADHLIRQGVIANTPSARAQVSNYLSLAKEHFESTRHGYWAVKRRAQGRGVTAMDA